MLFLSTILAATCLRVNTHGRARAQAPAQPLHSRQRVELFWRAPKGCPSRDWVYAETERLIGRSLDKVEVPRLEAHAAVEELKSGQWRLKLRTVQNNKTGERELKAKECRHLAETVALIMALSIDPRAVAASVKAPAVIGEPVWETGLEPLTGPQAKVAAETQVETPKPPAQQPTAPAAEAAGERAAEKGQQRPMERKEEYDREHLTEQPSKEKGLEQPAEKPTTGGKIAVSGFFDLNLLGDIGSLPGAGAGMDVTVGLELERLRLEISASLWPKRQARLEEARNLGAQLALWTFAPGACYSLGGRELSLGPCLRVEIGRMYGQGTGVSQRKNGGAFWLAPWFGARTSWQVVKRGALGLELGCAVPIFRRNYTLSVEGLTDRAVVHRPAAVAPRARLGAEIRF